MVSKKDEIMWVVDEFPPDQESLDSDREICSVSSPAMPTAMPPSRLPAESDSDSSSPTTAQPEPAALQIPVSAATSPPFATPSSLPPVPEVVTHPELSISAEVRLVPSPKPVTVHTASVPIESTQPPRLLVRGERLELNSLLSGESRITFELLGSSPGDVKFLCLGLDGDEHLLGPEYCVGPRQPSSPCGGILYKATADGGHSMVLCPASLPTNLKRMEFSAVVATADGVVGNGVAGVRVSTSRGVLESTDLSPRCASSACVTLVEVYERQGEWRLGVVCEVLATSVDELLKKHGAARGEAK